MSPDEQAQRSERITVTIDARALDGSRMGTQVHVLELVRALARTERLRLRVLVRGAKIDRATLELVRALPGTELLDERDITPRTPPSAVFHRPVQTFSHEDVALACNLGERVVLSQLDLIAYRNPDYLPDTDAHEAYRRASRHGMAAAERVVVFSEHTRGELLAEGLVEEERIMVVPPGLDHGAPAAPTGADGVPPARRPVALGGEEEEEEGGPFAAGDGFLLCLGADYAHKNRPFALGLLAELRARHGWDGRLVFAGAHVPHGSSRESERELLVTQPELARSTIDLGPVAEDERAWLMAHAGAVVYPSMYEGFGLVPFECALQGVPCLFAACSALAEGPIAKAATIVPWDPVASAAAAHELLTDVQARAAHLRLLEQAAQGLTWERAAEAMVAIYHEALRAPARVAATLSRDALARERVLAEERRRDVERLIGERELVLADYEALRAEVGAGRSLVGPDGSLPEDLQRGLLALSAHPAFSRPLYGALVSCYRLARALGRGLARLSGRRAPRA